MSVTNFIIKMHESNESIDVKRTFSKLNYRLQLLYHCYGAFLFYVFFRLRMLAYVFLSLVRDVSVQ